MQSTNGYPLGTFYQFATIPYIPIGNLAALSGFALNTSADVAVLVDTGKLIFKTVINPYPDVIYVSGAFIV